MTPFTVPIGEYGPGSVRIGNVVMLPDEARNMMKEMEYRPIHDSLIPDNIKDACFVQAVYRFGDEYGTIVAEVAFSTLLLL